LAADQGICPVCGLNFRSETARTVERANGELHHLQDQLDALTAQHVRWIDYRKQVLAAAPRLLATSGAPSQTSLDAWPVAAEPGAVQPVAVQPVTAQPVAAGPVAADAFASDPFLAAPVAQQAAAEPIAPDVQWSGGASHASPAASGGWSPASSMRPARTLSASALLGVSGAALFILAGIVFVAASWSAYGPMSRMAILVAFAATFAWLAVTATKHSFATVGGALGVVSAAFVGVSVYALTTGPDGPAPFTLAVASLIAGIAGLGLSRLRIGGVGSAAAGAVVFAVESGAFEAAVRASSVTEAAALYAIVAAAGGCGLIATRSLWTSSVQQDIASYGGAGVVLMGAAVAVVAPLSTRSVDPYPLIALVASALACAGVAAWRPLWGAGALAGVLTLGAMSAGWMWELGAHQIALVGAISAVTVVMGLSLAPTTWRTPGLVGVVPALTFMGLVTFRTVTDDFMAALVGGQDPGGRVPDGGVALIWCGVALVLVSAIPLITARWSPPALDTKPRLEAFAAVVFAAGTLSMGAGAAVAVAEGPGATGMGLALAACVQWLVAPVWRATLARTARHAAVVIVGLAGVHGASVVALASSGSVALWWGSGAIVLSLIGLGLVSPRVPAALGWFALVVIGTTASWTWQASGYYGTVLIAVALAAVLIALIARWLPERFVMPVTVGSAPAYVVSGVGIVVGLLAATVNSFSTHPTSNVPVFVWAPILAACAAVAGPVFAALVARVEGGSGLAVTRVVSGAGFLGLAIAGLAWLQQSISTAEDVAPMLVDSISAALAVGTGGVVFAVAALVPWWRPARWPVGIGVVVLVTAHSIAGLGGLTFDVVDLWWTVASVATACAALGIAARWVPRVTVAPAVFVTSLIASAALIAHHPEQSLAAGAVAFAFVAWAARWTRGQVRASVLIGGSGVALVAAGSLAFASAGVFDGFLSVYGGDGVAWRPWHALVAAALTGAALSWPRVRRIGASVVAVAFVAAAGLVPWPIGWIALAIIGLVSAELAARWRGKWGLHPFVPLGVGLAAVVWTGGGAAMVAMTLGAVAIAALWTAVRAGSDGVVRSASLALAPVGGSIAAGIALGALGVSPDIAATIAAGTGLTMPLIAAAVGLDKSRGVAIGVLAGVSVVGPVATWDLALAGLVAVMASAGWFALSTLGVKWARWIALGGLSVVATLLAAAVGIATLEAYTAIPAASMVLVGVWWMRRDSSIRTYVALSPGLGIALVPSYIALLVSPQAVTRPVALMAAAVILAALGVALRWFAPLLATAVTTVVVAVSQLTVADSLAPVWANVAVIGAVLFGLALLAERIKAMR